MNFFRVKIDFFETRLNLFLQMIKKGFLSGVECKVLITSVPKSGTHLVTKLFTDFFNYEKFGDGVNRMYCVNTEGCFNEIRRRISWLPRMSFIAGHIFFDSELNKSILEKKMGHDNLSMFKNLLKYRHESKKQVCNSFTYFRG